MTEQTVQQQPAAQQAASKREQWKYGLIFAGVIVAGLTWLNYDGEKKSINQTCLSQLSMVPNMSDKGAVCSCITDRFIGDVGLLSFVPLVRGLADESTYAPKYDRATRMCLGG